MAFQLVNTKIKVEGNSGDVLFHHLVINQYLADVNSFSFTWRQPEGNSALNDHIRFYQQNLSKAVTITINNDFTFKGVIHSINCTNHDLLGVSYEITGKGMFMKMDEVPECNSFYKKTLKQIFDAVNTTQGTTLKLSPTYTKELFYTVQYNQTGFRFLSMMAARHGEWFYYNGQEMVLGKPSGEAISLKQNEDVHEIDISARLVKANHMNASFDKHKGEFIKGEKKESSSLGGFLEAAAKGAETAFGTGHNPMHVAEGFNNDIIKEKTSMKQMAASASSVFITGRSYNTKLKLGGKIKITDSGGGNAGEYIITEIHHNCTADTNYQNRFTAIPADVKVPPYTNPHLFAICKPQPALVVENEDKDGLDRIKVRFPWMPEKETTPWISALVPHAGKDKGFRFLPEKNEEVMVGFQDNNAERPYVMGAVHTEKNKGGNDHAGNHIKVIGSRTGRRMEINDDKGSMRVIDNYVDKNPINALFFSRKDSDTYITLQSRKDDTNGSSLDLTNEESLELFIKKGDKVTTIKMESGGNKITIKSKAIISIEADNEINMKAMKININATNELNMEGKSSVKMHGAKVEVKADATMDVKGTATTVEGSAKLDLKGGAMTSITAALVKIN